MVNSLLKDEFDNMGLHALSLRLKTPEEWEKEVDVASAKMGVWLIDLIQIRGYVNCMDVLVFVQKQLSIYNLEIESTQRERVGNDTTM